MNFAEIDYQPYIMKPSLRDLETSKLLPDPELEAEEQRKTRQLKILQYLIELTL